MSEYVNRISRTTSTTLVGRTISDARLAAYTRRVAAILILTSPLVVIVVIGNIMILHAHDIRRGVPSLISHDFTSPRDGIIACPANFHTLHERFENARPHAEIVQYLRRRCGRLRVLGAFVFASALSFCC